MNFFYKPFVDQRAKFFSSFRIKIIKINAKVFINKNIQNEG